MRALFGRPRGDSIGQPGASLTGSQEWAQDARVGDVARLGEVRTGRLLDAAADRPGGFTVLHDLRVPGSRADIDHVVVHGDRVLPVDSKVWAQGRYVTRDGVTTRDGAPFPAADSPTLTRAAARLLRVLPPHAVVEEPLLLVWPSPTAVAAPDLSGVLVPGVVVMPAEKGAAWLAGRRFRRLADPVVVAALRELVVAGRGRG